MLKKFFLKKIENVEIRELEDFVSRMRYLDSDTLGYASAMVAVWADELSIQNHWNLYYPHTVIEQDLAATMKLVNMVKQVQKTGDNNRATGGLVWVHTLRACSNLKLMGGVREMWSHIERGFPHTEVACSNLGFEVPRRWGVFPDGFTPKVK